MTANSIPVITVDGPSGSGKGTMSQMLANNLKWHFLDSGAIYRILAYAVMQKEIAYTDVNAIAQLASQLEIEFNTAGKIFLAGNDITAEIRTEECGNVASKVSAFAEVRAALMDRQRAFKKWPGLVADGRDMGTIVFPDAQLKFFLIASAEERATRRYNQLKEKGLAANYAIILKDIKERDNRDQKRTVAPLKPAEDAIVIDTTGSSIEQVYFLMMQHVDKHFTVSS